MSTIPREEYDEVVAAWFERGTKIDRLRQMLSEVERFILANYGPPATAEGIELMQDIATTLRNTR